MSLTLGDAREIKTVKIKDKEKSRYDYPVKQQIRLPLKIVIDGHSVDCEALVEVTLEHASSRIPGGGLMVNVIGHDGSLYQEKFAFFLSRPNYDSRNYFPPGYDANPANFGSLFMDLPKDIRERINDIFYGEQGKRLSKTAVDEAKRYYVKQQPSWNT